MSTATIEKADYASLVNKKATVVRNLPEPNEKGEGTVEVEGTVQAANDMGILIKPKGKTNFELIELAEIEDVYLTPEVDKKFVASKLKPIEDGKMRRHLLDRHGVSVKWANEADEKAAVEYHDTLDHKALDLGHVHRTVEEAAADAATATETEQPTES